MKLIDLVQRLAFDDAGADATDYALLAACLAMPLVVAGSMLGITLDSLFTSVSTSLPAPPP